MKKLYSAGIVLLASFAFVYGETAGYPRPMSFRSINAKALQAGRYDSVEMVVTDLHTCVRRDAAREFKKIPPQLMLCSGSNRCRSFFGRTFLSDTVVRLKRIGGGLR